MENRKLILASSSPRRKEILESFNLDFVVIPAEIEEKIDNSLSPEKNAEQLACQKAKEVFGEVSEITDVYVIGVDTIVVIESQILGKPNSKEEAKKMLSLLSGKTHKVISGICIIKTDDDEPVMEFSHVVTNVTMKGLDDDTIDKYISTNEPMDKAGAYGIQGFGIFLVEKIEGSYSNVVGLPSSKLYDMLKNMGYDLLS